MTKILESWLLPIAMLAGIILHPWIGVLSPVIPGLLFVMLYFTFCRISPRELHFRKLHLFMLGIQIAASLLVYFLLKPVNPILAQGAMICILVSPATTSPVITGILGGDLSYSTSFLFSSNIAVAIAAPVIFSSIGLEEGGSFTSSALVIGAKLFPILLLPLICAWVTRLALPKLHAWVTKKSIYSLYLWGCSLAIVTGNTVYFILNQKAPEYWLEISLAAAALAICIVAFFSGKLLGRIFHEPISCGQSFGQKNTVLAIWMALTFTNPLASVAPASYVFWQNIFNAWQIWRKQKGSERT